MARVGTDPPNASVAANDFALLTHSLNARSNLHSFFLLQSLVAVCDSTTLKVVRGQFHLDAISRKDPDVVHSHLAGDMGQNRMTILELDPKHRVGQRF